VVYYWIQNAIVQARKLNVGSPYCELALGMRTP